MLNFREIAEGARAFYTVGQGLGDKVGPEAIPYYIDTALACELFMKAMIVYHRPDISIHDLRKINHSLNGLFDALPLNTKEKIKAKIPDNKIKEMQRKKILQYKELLKGDKAKEAENNATYMMQKTASSFEEILKDNANIFKTWRYFYEADNPISCDLWFLHDLCAELYNIMAEIINRS